MENCAGETGKQKAPREYSRGAFYHAQWRGGWRRITIDFMQNNTEPDCPNCNGNSYSWGAVRSQYGLQYIDDNAGFWGKTAFGGERIKARKCNTCGNVQFFSRETK